MIKLASGIVLACVAAPAQSVSLTIATGPGPMAIAVNETTNKAYVINRGNNSVAVIDGKSRSVLRTIPTGSGPEGIAVNAVTNRVYVANAGDSAVTVIDGGSDAAIATIRAGSYCQALAVNPATNKIYVANNYGHSVTVIDGVSHATATVRVGQGPRGIVVNPVTNKVYTANYGSKDASEIDGATGSVKSIPTGKHPWMLAVDSRANKIYVVNEDSASVSIVDGATGAVKNVAVGEIPFAVAVNPATNRAYVLTYAENTMAVIDGATGTVTKTLTLASHPSAVAVNSKTDQVFVASQTGGAVDVFDGTSNAITDTVKVDALPYSIGVDSAANQVYVANLGSGNATVIQAELLNARPHPPKFRVLALAERASGDHQKFVDAARLRLDKMAAESDFAVDYITGTERITKESLAQYSLVLQLNYPPYHWAPRAKEAFVEYITQGKGGWVGFHHASLLGEFDGYPMDPWFSEFLGGIRFMQYIPDFAKATVRIEDRASPLAKGLPETFVIEKEEWYTWSRSPRPNVSVFASVDESSYLPSNVVKMGGDHPVVWSNPHYKARNLYIFMGHHAGLFDSPEFVQLFRNAVFWGAGQ
ncbi:MAG TPA: ThuA domain-containing protein [Bryobacteraceae bacterium]